MCGIVALLSLFGAQPARAKAGYHSCAQDSVPPGSLAYRRVTALRTSCSTAEDVVYDYAEEWRGQRRITLSLTTARSTLDWVCTTRTITTRDYTVYGWIRCKARGGHRVRFRGYS